MSVALADDLAALLARDLQALRRAIAAYPDERDLWRLAPGIANSAGTLTLHLAGNLQHFIGAVLGGSGYRRDRAAEFARRDVPRSELLMQVDQALAAVQRTLPGCSGSVLAAEFPEPVGGVRVVTGEFLLHLAVHLAYHLGQVDYHRRIVTGHGETVNAMALGELRSARQAGAQGDGR